MKSLAGFQQTTLVNGLRSCRLFQGLPLDDLRQLADITLPRRLDKGAYLFHEGEPCTGFFIVQAGAINVHRLNAAGKEQVIQVFRPGDSFAEAAVVSETGFPAHARALESALVLQVRKDGFLAVLRRNPELALRILGSMSHHLKVLVARIEDLTAKDVETRLANWLLQRCPEPEAVKPVMIELTTTKRLLASELGTVSETFSRTLAKFREQKLVSVSGRKVTVLQPARLRALLRRNLGGSDMELDGSAKGWTCRDFSG
ncbi:MAG TPA: Crp/Fnr family transcriptional regulator [Candidatus Paceibacterota bacterium]|nr:Crp/Fnr family transcriptional regulator [Verrucomicrobiota bacterium]HRY46976.1 Crp/Fnr family transcriptional regulator [Candidatus Paceibacterota bacterium]HSA00218.1 Crp/Fnr family transcriptional regulator [Candidatus Paceibacterota bacterium]